MSGAMTESREDVGVLEACKTVGSVMCADYRKLTGLTRRRLKSHSGSLRAVVEALHLPVWGDCGIMPGSAKIRSRRSIKEVHMYAVIKTGGKQYRVAAGEKIKVEQIAADVGQEIVFDQVLAVGSGAELKVGTPLVSGATVSVTVLAHGKHDKVSIFKMRRRKHYQKRQGHRQQFTELLIGAISA
jgi:large subunit ribosomal protein L21